MRIIDRALMKEFSSKTHCEWCRRPADVQCHHVFARGQEGCRRLDIRINLIALCPQDHARVHAGQIMRDDMLAIVAQREKTTQDAIEREIYRLRRL